MSLPSHRLALIVMAAILIVTIGGCAAPPANQSVPGTTQTQAPADPQVADAIQQVIQLGNTEQTQAIANRDPSVISDTATGRYYRELLQTYQDMVSQGATSIQLTNLTWGAITANGTDATANTVETWVTTFSDGTTDQSTDGNIYTLVNQGGSWLIQDDRQPTTASPAVRLTPGPSAGPRQTPVPTLVAAAGQDTSRNWSGYAATGATYTGINGTWIVPQVEESNGGSGVGATWVGIGGVNTRDLIQAGTEDSGSGRQNEYQAWIEMLPAASKQVTLAVAPGDSITVSIDEQGVATNNWQIIMTNNTSGKTYQTTVHYVSSRSSVEWIEEAPTGRTGIMPIDNFGKVSFSGATAVVNGENVHLDQVGARPISLLNARRQPLAVPSAIGSDGQSFGVERTSAPVTTTSHRGLR
jgi:ABC-type uncharacterized transport system auxiliary subunit